MRSAMWTVAFAVAVCCATPAIADPNSELPLHSVESLRGAVGPRGHAVFTAFANLAGCPGLALPCAPARCGLPIGFQLVAAPGNDELLISLGRAYQAARPWSARRSLLDAA